MFLSLGLIWREIITLERPSNKERQRLGVAEKEKGSRGKDGGWLRAETGILGAEEVLV